MRGEVDSQNFVYSATTGNVRVSAQPVFLDDQSNDSEGQYVWAYKIRIENKSEEVIQLLARYWQITDCNGMAHEIEGSGVVGEQPVIKPGEQFEYSSYASLTTPSGLMSGRYRMSSHSGRLFEVAIPSFSLDSPEQLRYPN